MKEPSFEWNEDKNLENQRKHGVSFYEAQHAFMDTRRVIAEDIKHNRNEQRFYCFGLNADGNGILRPFGSPIGSAASESLEQAIGEKGRRSMSKQIHYSDEPIGEVGFIPDFLPSPEQLALKSEQTKITIALSVESVAFFKEAAKRHHTQYQKMIRQLLDEYVARHKA